MANDCPHCDRTFPAKKALSDHINRAHPDAGGPPSRTPWVIGALVVLAVAVVGAAILMGGGDVTAREQFHIEDSPHLGDLDAPVALVAFESPACVTCKELHTSRGGDPATMDLIKENYAKTGKIVYVEKYARAGYPWENAGAHSQKCAWELGGPSAFFNLTQTYYDQQSQINSNNLMSFVSQWASSEPTVTSQEMVDCTREERFNDDLTQDLADGASAGVRGTPTIYLIDASGKVTQLPFGGYATYANAIEGALDRVEAPQDPGETNQTEAQGNGTG